jgi:hypothetical protein
VLDLHEACLNVSTALTILPGPRHVQRVFELARVDQIVFSGTPAATMPSRDERRRNDDP